jgi:hypothetical protein
MICNEIINTIKYTHSTVLQSLHLSVQLEETTTTLISVFYQQTLTAIHIIKVLCCVNI